MKKPLDMNLIGKYALAVIESLHHRHLDDEGVATVLGVAIAEMFANADFENGDVGRLRAFDVYQKLTRGMLIEIMEQGLTEEGES